MPTDLSSPAHRSGQEGEPHEPHKVEELYGAAGHSCSNRITISTGVRGLSPATTDRITLLVNMRSITQMNKRGYPFCAQAGAFQE